MARDWTDEAKQLAVDLWNQGVSASIIAGELAQAGFPGLTRSAVLGKIHRTIAKGDKRVATRVAKVHMRLPTAPRPLALSRSPRTARATPMPSPRPAPKPAIPPDPAKFRSILELRAFDNLCRYPVSEDGKPFLACGAPTESETVSYCTFHANLCFQSRRHAAA